MGIAGASQVMAGLLLIPAIPFSPVRESVRPAPTFTTSATPTAPIDSPRIFLIVSRSPRQIAENTAPKNGAVELDLPPNSNFQIEAYSRHGEVESDFSGPGLKVDKEAGTPSITGTYGKGGPMIRINTEYGAIKIVHAGPHPPAPPAPPTPPTPPAPPSPPSPSGTARQTRNRGMALPLARVAFVQNQTAWTPGN